MENSLFIPINTEFDIIFARQKGREIAKQLGFSATELAFIATAISELTRNIISYAKAGDILISLIHEVGKKGICIVAKDHGPGIENIELALQEGYSTSNSLGLGLPGVRRLMDDFTIQSHLGQGTIITTKKWVKS